MDKKPQRKSLRLKEYDYNQAGYYFVTICTKGKIHCLGEVVGSAAPCAPPIVRLSQFGKITEKYIQLIGIHNKGVNVDKYVIMPNHLHAIIIITDSGGQGSARPTNKTSGTLSRIVHGFKRLTNKESEVKMWQTSYYDHIIRNEQDYLRVWKYIDLNPAKWETDEYYN